MYSIGIGKVILRKMLSRDQLVSQEKKFWTHPEKGTVMRLVKNPKTGKYENVYEGP